MDNKSSAQMLFGLDPSSINIIENIFSSKMKSKSYHVFVFGSRATGKHKKYSDMDLWVESNPPLTEDELSHLRESFENSDLAIKVDLATPETCLEDYKARITSEMVKFI